MDVTGKVRSDQGKTHCMLLKEDKENRIHTTRRVSLTCSVRLLLSSVWIHALRVSSVMKIWAALANRTGASALIICTEEMELHSVKYTHRLSNIIHTSAITWITKDLSNKWLHRIHRCYKIINVFKNANAPAQTLLKQTILLSWRMPLFFTKTL